MSEEQREFEELLETATTTKVEVLQQWLYSVLVYVSLCVVAVIHLIVHH
jgi:hypothetical protein